MPLIEELPTTGPTRVSHGWAYVPDTGPIAAMVQPGSRKRNRNDAGTTNATATAKQQKAVQVRLESLDKENWKDGVTVGIPARKDGRAGAGKKMTPNVRRILTYQRTFQHYLADEEAGITTGGNSGPSASSTSMSGTQTTLQRTDSRRKSNISETTTTSKRGGRERKEPTTKAASSSMQPPPSSRSRSAAVKQENETTPHTTNNPTPQPQDQSTPTPTQKPSPPQSKPPYDPKLDTHPLLRTLNLPKLPSATLMNLLTTEPPLSYTASRAMPTDAENANAKPPRHFCAMCGYLGRVKCRKCGEWTCGVMECWGGHEGVCVAMGMY